MTVAFSAFYSELRPEVPLCPSFAMDQALRAAAIEFCQRSNVWQQTFDLGVTVAGTADYQMTGITTGAEIHDILDVFGYYSRLLGADDRTLTYYPTWRTDTGIPAYFKFKYPDSITLIPKPSAASADHLTIVASLKPTRSAANLPDIMNAPYFDAIRHGALARLLDKKSAPGYDPNEAINHLKQFNLAIRSAAHDVLTGKVGATPQLGIFA